MGWIEMFNPLLCNLVRVGDQSKKFYKAEEKEIN